MATSETLLTAIAIRLAAILVAGLVARNAATDLPRQQAACASERSAAVDLRAKAAEPEANGIMRDMLQYD